MLAIFMARPSRAARQIAVRSSGSIYPAGQFSVMHAIDLGTGDYGFTVEASGGVIVDYAGNLYGVTCQGGGHNGGTIYRIDPSGGYVTLQDFDEGYVNWGDYHVRWDG